MTTAKNRLPGSERVGWGFNPYGDFNEPVMVGPVCDTSAEEVEYDIDGKTYSHAKSVEFMPEPLTDSVEDAFTTRDEYERHVTTKLNIQGKYGDFSASFKATFGSDYTSLTERCGALLTWFNRIGTLHLKNNARLTDDFTKDLAALPEQFSGQTAFYDFFRKYGTYVISSVTIGGSLDYAMLIDRKQTTSKSTLTAKVTAEYGVMFKGSASQKDIEEVKRFSEHRTSRLTTRGGDSSLSQINVKDPADNSAVFNSWRSSIAKNPAVFSMQLTRIDVFAKGAKAQAISAAIDKYLGGSLLVESTWIESAYVLSGAQANAFPGSNAVLRAILLDKLTLKPEEKRLQAPEPGSPDSAYTTFWNTVHAHITSAAPSQKMLVIATERWPRDRQYFPPVNVREALLAHGAREETINRWDALTRNTQPCPFAGLSYVLAGDNGRNKGFDALSAGFGDPNSSLRPTARVSVLLPRTVTGLVRVILELKEEKSATELVQFHSHSGGLLSADPDGSKRVLIKNGDTKRPEQLWYLRSGPTRDGMQPYVLFNYATCGVLQGKVGGGESELMRFNSNIQDDVLWDIRGTENRSNLLLVHYHPQSWNLTNIGASAAVRTWYQDGMIWSRFKSDPQ